MGNALLDHIHPPPPAYLAARSARRLYDEAVAATAATEGAWLAIGDQLALAANDLALAGAFPSAIDTLLGLARDCDHRALSARARIAVIRYDRVIDMSTIVGAS